MLVALVLAPPQELDLEPFPPTPYDKVIRLEITADDPELIEGRGPTAVCEYRAEFDGALHVWTRSELDLFIQVDDIQAFRTLASDDDSGGGSTPYTRVDVRVDGRLAVLVASPAGGSGPVTLHLVASPETEVTREAAARARAAMEGARRLDREGDETGARALLASSAEKLARVTGGRESHLVSDTRVDLASLTDEMGDLAGANVLHEAVVSSLLRTRPKDHLDLLYALHNLAALRGAIGDLAGARALEEVVLAGYERVLPEDHEALFRARYDLAVSMYSMGDPTGARELLEASLEEFEGTLPEDHTARLLAQAALAVTKAAEGDLVGARALQEAVLEKYESTLPENHPQLLLARANLAASMRRMGDPVGARALQESVLAGYESVLPEDHPDVLRARVNLAKSMSEMGDAAEGIALCEAALSACEESLPEDHPLVLVAQDTMAATMLKVGDLVGARELLETVLASYERKGLHNHPPALGARANLASVVGQTGDLVGARTLWETLLAFYESALPEDSPDALLVRNSLAMLLDEMGDADRACSLARTLTSGIRSRALASLTLAPRQTRQTVASEDGRLSGVVFLSRAEPTLTNSVFELTETLRLVAGEAARSLARWENDPGLASLLDEAASLRRQLNDLVAGTTRDLTSADRFQEELTRLTLARDALERDASRQLAERGVTTIPVDTGSLASALSKRAVAVGYRRLAPWGDIGERVIAHALTSEGVLTRVDLGPAVDLEELADAWRSSLGAPIRTGSDGSVSTNSSPGKRGVGVLGGTSVKEVEVGRSLRARILDPVLAACGESATRLHVCADDLLFLVPFDALPEGDGRIGDRLQVVNEISFARLLAGALPATSEPSLAALGGVTYGGTPAANENARRSAMMTSFGAIPESGHEAEAVASLFDDVFDSDATLLTGKEATKAALFEAAPGIRYLHIATHGWFAPESVKSILDEPAGDQPFASMSLEERLTGLAPMTLCGLALAGANRGRDSLGRVPGILTAEELCSLDLSQCELAVLSACETNVGIRRAGQGIQSLQAALYAAGARTSITSLWKVDDAATRRLFELFYTKLWKEKLGKADALWHAKTALRSEGHPVRDWAGWVLTGDPE
jgi:CHAT domain-containing protein/tetratricopeptide (TPR) repeat protein